MTEMVIRQLPGGPLHAMEIWSHPADVSQRFKVAFGMTLPAMGHCVNPGPMRLMRHEPTVWLADGDVSRLPDLLQDDGALTAIGGGIVRIHLAGRQWRRLLMEGGVFDAEAASFAPGRTAATIIDGIAIRLNVIAEDVCETFVPRSFAHDLLHFWRTTADWLD